MSLSTLLTAQIALALFSLLASIVIVLLWD